jgi:hypothetical protein
MPFTVAAEEAPASTAYTKVPLLELELLRDELTKLEELELIRLDELLELGALLETGVLLELRALELTPPHTRPP